METSVPSNDEVVQAVQDLRQTQPDLSRAKMLQHLKESRKWNLSEARFKKVVQSMNQQLDALADALAAQLVHSENQDLGIPEDALAAQREYHENSVRHFKIYGRGEYNYGVTPNADQGILIDLARSRLSKMPRPQSRQAKRSMAGNPFLRVIWDFYVAAAAIAGIPKTDVGLQIEAEYGVPWTYLPTPATEETGPTAAHRKAVFKQKSLDMKRAMLKLPDGKKYIPVDDRGEPIWDEAKNGQFALIVVKIDKGEGLQEFGRVGKAPV